MKRKPLRKLRDGIEHYKDDVNKAGAFKLKSKKALYDKAMKQLEKFK